MIEVRNLQKIVDGRTVLDIQQFDLQAGETAAILGAAGSGVETLQELLTGRARPTAGSIRLAGLDPASDREAFSRRVGVLFGDDNVYRNLTPRGNLAFFARLYGLPEDGIDKLLVRVGLADQADAASSKLSGSLLRRLAFGRAILHGPQVLLLIDPFTRCDEATIGLFTGLIRSLADKRAAVLVLAADQTHLSSICDWFYAMNGGRLTALEGSGETGRTVQLFKVPVRAEDKVILVNPAEILYADASQGRAFLVTAEGRLATQFTLNELEQRLKRSGFFRTHRSYLVNLQHVREVIPFTRNAFSLRLDDPSGTQIPLSKSAAGELKDLLGY